MIRRKRTHFLVHLWWSSLTDHSKPFAQYTYIATFRKSTGHVLFFDFRPWLWFLRLCSQYKEPIVCCPQLFGAQVRNPAHLRAQFDKKKFWSKPWRSFLHTKLVHIFPWWTFWLRSTFPLGLSGWQRPLCSSGEGYWGYPALYSSIPPSYTSTDHNQWLRASSSRVSFLHGWDAKVVARLLPPLAHLNGKGRYGYWCVRFKCIFFRVSRNKDFVFLVNLY